MKEDRDDVVICDVCGERIFPGDRYYEMVDGMIVCGDSDCLKEWMHEYRRQMPRE
jgi:hypothetical protein